MYYSQRPLCEAQRLYDEFLEMRKRPFGHERLDAASGLNNLLDIHRAQGSFKEVERLYVKSLEMSRRLYA